MVVNFTNGEIKMTISQLTALMKQLPYFTKQNLSLALGIEGENLNYWIKKLTRERLIMPLKKGFYVSSYYQEARLRGEEELELYWMYIANVLRSPSYVSLEYALSRYGLIAEEAVAVTSTALKSSRRYESETKNFIYRNIKQSLFGGYRSLELGNTGLIVKTAVPAKALFDFLYLKKFSTGDELRIYLTDVGRFNWGALTAEDKKSFRQIVKKANSAKMSRAADILQKDRIL